MPPVFYSPDMVTKLSADLKYGMYTDIAFEPLPQKRVFVVEGKNALASIVACLEKKFQKKYKIILYNMQDGENVSFVYLDFLNNCREYFGKKDDINGSEFKYLLGNWLNNTILILNDFLLEFIPYFEKLFYLLNKQSFDFYIFAVIPSETPVQARL